MTDPEATADNFIRRIVQRDIASGKFGGRVCTRFPPEPNGYLHIGHAKAICLNFGIAEEFGGRCNLRFDDTNPEAEDQEFVDAIQEDVRWLGFDWGGEPLFASDYFDQLYEWAVALVEKGSAYVDSSSLEEIREQRGNAFRPGRNSPYRDRSVEENLDLLERMKNGEFAEGEHVLRAKIDMASPNMNMRDPALYRVKHAVHHRTGDAWHIYPMYDWAHGQSDSIEGITHSLCTLEFENHRPLYDWFLDQLGVHHPQQIEFARLAPTHMVVSKRKLLRLVRDGQVTGWDDPRMPTLRGLRRRGYPPEAIRKFCAQIGVARFNAAHDIDLLERAVREELNARAERRLVVLDPVELVITNWPEGKVEEVDAINNPEDESAGTRKLPISGRLYIERDDFLEDPPKKFFRLAPGREVRLRYGYYVTCDEVEKDADGNVVRLLCTHDPESRGGSSPDGRRVKGTIHWVSAEHAVDVEVRLYDHLFATPAPEDVPEGQDFTVNLNPDSLRIVRAKAEPGLAGAEPGSRWQFERKGYFCVDTNDSEPGAPVFNRTVTLRDSWAKIAKQGEHGRKGG